MEIDIEFDFGVVASLGVSVGSQFLFDVVGQFDEHGFARSERLRFDFIIHIDCVDLSLFSGAQCNSD